MKKWQGFILAAAAAVMLSGCSTPFGLAGTGVFNGNGNDLMQRIKITKSDWDPLTGKNPLTYAQYLGVQEVAVRLGVQIAWQTSSNAEACGTNGLAYFGAGAGGGLVEGMEYSGADTVPSALTNGAIYGLGGCVNGVVTHSYDGDQSVGDSLEKALRDIENDDKEFTLPDGSSLFHDVHVTAAYVRSRNNMNSPAPELARHMPDFHGPVVGSPGR